MVQLKSYRAFSISGLWRLLIINWAYSGSSMVVLGTEGNGNKARDPKQTSLGMRGLWNGAIYIYIYIYSGSEISPMAPEIAPCYVT